MKILFFFAFILFIFHKQVKPFEGSVHYKHSFVDLEDIDWHNGNMFIYGTKSTFEVNQNGYRFLTPNAVSKFLLYCRADTTLYYGDDSDTLRAETAFYTGDSIISMSIADTNVTILGHLCKRFTILLQHKQGYGFFKRTYYYSNDFPVDEKIFNACKNRMMDIIFREIKAVPLRIDWEKPGKYRVEMIADKIQPEKLADSLFAVPKNKVVIRNPAN
jgi:hypothetical protein